MVQWIELHAFTAEGLGSIPGQGTKIPQAVHYGQKKRSEVIFIQHNMHKADHAVVLEESADAVEVYEQLSQLSTTSGSLQLPSLISQLSWEQ